MPSQKPNKVIIDTNLWISFLIGKELQHLKDLIISNEIQLITTNQLQTELKTVVERPKLQKYFKQEKVVELLSLLEIISKNVKLKDVPKVCRDPKDDFLLALCKRSKADYLVTGDSDLLVFGTYGKTEILTMKEFREKFK